MADNTEIERKYLVKDTQFIKDSFKQYKIKQGYLSTDPERVVRVRIKESKGFITIKGKSNKSGTTRFEWEKEIDILEAESLLEIALPGVIDKTRYLVNFKNQIFEIDVFYGDNSGLILAELELLNEEQEVYLPKWITEEVTADPRYYNSYLIDTPFIKWKKA